METSKFGQFNLDLVSLDTINTSASNDYVKLRDDINETLNRSFPNNLFSYIMLDNTEFNILYENVLSHMIPEPWGFDRASGEVYRTKTDDVLVHLDRVRSTELHVIASTDTHLLNVIYIAVKLRNTSSRTYSDLYNQIKSEFPTITTVQATIKLNIKVNSGQSGELDRLMGAKCICNHFESTGKLKVESISIKY